MRVVIFLFFFAVFLLLFVLSLLPAENYDFCYICDYPNTYVQVSGKDSSEMRKKAFEKYACRVYATIEYCSVTHNPTERVTIYGVLK